MEYSKLVAVTGLPGLFELINSKTDGAIVRSLTDKSTRFVSSRIHNFSHLESIEIYTVRDNVNMVELFNAMEKAGGTLPDDKDAAAVKKYASDMKKMVKWFDVLQKNKVEIKLSELPEEEEEEVVAEPVVEEKPAKKATAKKKEAATEEGEPAPKKTARKKKAE